MMKYLAENKVLSIILVIGIIASGIGIGGRISTERANKNYDIVFDFAELQMMAEQSEHDVEWWLAKLPEMGIKRVALTEESLDIMRDDPSCPVDADVFAEIAKNADWRSDYPAGFVAAMEEAGLDRFDAVARVFSNDIFYFISENFNKRFEPEKYILYPADDGREGGYVWMDGVVSESLYKDTYKEKTTDDKGFIEDSDMIASKILYQSIGLSRDKVAMIENAGLEVVPRTFSYEGWNTTKYAKAVIEGYSSLKSAPAYMIVGGASVIGYDDGIEVVSDYMNSKGTSIGLIEMTDQLKNIDQDGLNEVIEATDYNTVRVFSVWPYIQYRYGYYGYAGSEEVENTLFRAITERNIRVIYYKPMKETDDSKVYITDYEIYEDMFSNLDARLAEHGFTPGRASVMASYKTSPLLKILMGFGAIAALILTAGGIITISNRYKYILMILGALGVAGSFFVMPNTAKVVLSLGAAMSAACLVVVLVTMKAREEWHRLGPDAGLAKIIPVSAVTLIAGVALSLIGGIMTAAPISEIDFMLELSIYRGVKIAQLFPLAFFVLAFAAYYGFTKNKKKEGRIDGDDIISILNLDLKLWMVMVGCVFAGVGVYYIMRTGHTTNTIPSTPEMLMRNTLEEWLIARPRSKEFLFAFPALMMFIYTSSRRWKIWAGMFGLCSVIGITSVINTFMHIRTPLYLGFFRTGFSLIFGLILGVIAILIFEAGYKIIKKISAVLAEKREA